MRSRILLALLVVLIAAAAFGVWWWYVRAPRQEHLSLRAVSFADLPGWRETDATAALAAFRRSCAKIAALPPDAPMAYAGTARDWQKACAEASGDPRRFFETAFKPYAVDNGDGLVTGYYEPLLNGSTTRHGAYRVAVYGVPDDLVMIDLGLFRSEWKGVRIAGTVAGHYLKPYPARAEIDAHPPRTAPVLFWSDDPVSVFFLHIQGSGRVRLDDGRMLRVTYAGQNGHPYTPIGRTLIADGALKREEVSMQSIRAWLTAHPVAARRVMETDASFIFFKQEAVGDRALGPAGSEGVALTPRASIAVDPTIHPFGVPMFIAGEGVAGLFVAQDTGGAIRGPARADIFFGFGSSAEDKAGKMKAHARFFVLLPSGVAPTP
ncbi:MAG: murein transglycosylase A [Rhizomicrobium sp.]